MAVVNQVMVEVFHLLARDAQTSTSTTPAPTSVTAQTASPTSATPTSTMSAQPASGPTSSPLLFFVALGFGVVFTNLWIIVGVKYCFRYNARNRALRNGEDPDPIHLDNMPTRPHRRRREKKLMTMDEVNERFPLTKYKNWVATRAREGLPTAGGVNPAPSRAASVRDVDGVMPSSPTGTKHSVNTRPDTADGEAAEITISPQTNNMGGQFGSERKSVDVTVEETNALEQVHTTSSTVDKHITAATEDDDDDDDHIHTAVPPELLTNPGDSCAICIDTLEEDDDIRGLTCGHAFHAGCLDPWLTSRRACCPLCKADYYTPKPRPDGEVAETDRSGRRRGDPRMNLPNAPPSSWTGIRSNPRLMLPGRFGGQVYPDDRPQDRRDARRTRRRAAEVAAAETRTQPQENAGAAANEQATAPRRWIPRISNPFSRNGGAASAEQNTIASPSQLEAGVVR